MASLELANELADAKLEQKEDLVTPWVSNNQNSFRHQKKIPNIYIDFCDPELVL